MINFFSIVVLHKQPLLHAKWMSSLINWYVRALHAKCHQQWFRHFWGSYDLCMFFHEIRKNLEIRHARTCKQIIKGKIINLISCLLILTTIISKLNWLIILGSQIENSNWQERHLLVSYLKLIIPLKFSFHSVNIFFSKENQKLSKYFSVGLQLKNINFLQMYKVVSRKYSKEKKTIF